MRPHMPTVPTGPYSTYCQLEPESFCSPQHNVYLSLIASTHDHMEFGKALFHGHKPLKTIVHVCVDASLGKHQCAGPVFSCSDGLVQSRSCLTHPSCLVLVVITNMSMRTSLCVRNEFQVPQPHRQRCPSSLPTNVICRYVFWYVPT